MTTPFKKELKQLHYRSSSPHQANRLKTMKHNQPNQLADDLLAVTSGVTVGTIGGAILGLTGAGIIVPAVGSIVGGAMGLIVLRQQKKQQRSLELKTQSSKQDFPIESTNKARMTGHKKIRHSSHPKPNPYPFQLKDPS